VLGGTQSLHTDAFDEALALPTEEAARIALRTQQILAYESGVANTVDPLGGSYFVERLTLDMEQGAFAYFEKLDAMGGMVAAIERGFPQKEIADASYAYQRAVEGGQKVIVGVNEYVMDELARLRARRSNDAVERSLDALRRALALEPRAGRGRLSSANTMPYLLDCVRAYATLGEICDAMRAVLGIYQEVSIS
jgi:methylmalonyl-CoA mutase, N-terminal domain